MRGRPADPDEYIRHRRAVVRSDQPVATVFRGAEDQPDAAKRAKGAPDVAGSEPRYVAADQHGLPGPSHAQGGEHASPEIALALRDATDTGGDRNAVPPAIRRDRDHDTPAGIGSEPAHDTARLAGIEAPGGNAAETIRFYDALECGALPVVIDAPWLHAEAALGLCGPPPIVILDSWTALPDALVRYLSPSAEAGLSAQADACRHWWQTFKLRTGDRVTSLIETAFAAT